MDREPIFIVEELWIALNRKRQITRRTWRDVANEIGISASTFSRMALDDRPPNVDALCRMLVWLGDTDLKPYLRQMTDSPSPQPVEKTTDA